MAKNLYRLTSNVIPSKYEIELSPDLVNFTFKGSERITINVAAPTKVIVLNAKDLICTNVSLVGTHHKTAKISYNKKYEFVIFTFKQKILPSNYILSIDFNGVLNDKMIGFYRTKYFVNNVEKYAATTQFEPTDARRAFPCWDEPAIKAIFQLSFIVPVDKQVFFNTQIINDEIIDGKKVIRFAETPIMSTYIVAFIIGDYECLTTIDKNKTISICANPGKLHQCQFALSITPAILDYFQDYFQINYPLNKLDMVAIGDFSAGAMENWGLITYRESTLLLDESSSIFRKQNVVSVIAHELAHQWFGNLVTMKWWDDLWLNEGFASYIGTCAESHINDIKKYSWLVWDTFISDHTNIALIYDSYKNTHAIKTAVKCPRDIQCIFDTICYYKGASILRMLANYIGEDAMKHGLNKYLTKFQYSNAETNDLWDCLATDNINVGDIMSNWVNNPGYPLIRVYYRNGILVIKQERFMQKNTDCNSLDKWSIPIEYIISENGNKSKYKMLLTDMEIEKHVSPSLLQDGWIKFNHNATGFYRVWYDDNIYKCIVKAIFNDELLSTDILNFTNDVFFTNRYSIVKYLNLIVDIFDHFSSKNITELSNLYICIADITSNCNYILTLWEEYPHISTKFISFYEFIYKLLLWDDHTDDSDIVILLRELSINMLIKLKYQPIIELCKDIFDKNQSNLSNINVKRQSFIFNTVIINDQKSHYFNLIKNYFSPKMFLDDQHRILNAISKTADSSNIKLLLEWIFDNVKPSDLMIIYANVSTSSNGRTIAWEFIKNNWDKLYTLLGETKDDLSKLVAKVICGFYDDKILSDIQEFTKNKNLNIKMELEKITYNIDLKQRETDNLVQWARLN